MGDLRERARSATIRSAITSGVVLGGVASLPTLPLTLSLARSRDYDYHETGRTPALLSGSELGRLSVVVGVGANLCSLATKNPAPAIATFAASTLLGVANVVAGEMREHGFPPA